MTATQSNSTDFIIRAMTPDELPFALNLARLEGWNPGLYDMECFYAADPEGFMIGLLDGEPITCVSAVKYPGNVAFLGFYIVKEGYRGRGYGLQITLEALKAVESYNAAADGVIEQVENYKTIGFQPVYINSRYRGTTNDPGGETDPRIVDLADVPFDELYRYDTSIFFAPREAFLRLWISRPETVAIGMMNGDTMIGYAVLRKCFEGYKVGPLFAEDASIAEALFQELHRRVPPGTIIFLDVPGEGVNPAATAMARRYDMESVFDTARMYRLAHPDSKIDLPLHKWFGVTTLELG